MNKIVFLNGQGVDGVGSTKFMIEFGKLFEEVKIVNYINENGYYINGKNFELNGQIIDTNNIYEELKDEEMIFINSFPNNKSSLEEINKFYYDLTLLSEKGIKLMGFMHFNTLAYLNKVPKILYGLNLLDTIFTFNVKSDFAKEIERFIPYKKNDLKAFSLPYECKNVDFYQKQDLCIYMGRYATFKNPEKMLDIIVEGIKYEYHGCSRTIETKAILFTKGRHIKYVNKTKPLPKFLNTETGLFEEEPYKNGDILVYGHYKNQEGLEIMKKAKFAFSGFKLKAENYGDRFEYAMAEMINAQCICIFSNHFLENVFIHGKSLAQYNTFISYDFNNPEETKKRIIEINNNEELRKEIILKQYLLLQKLQSPPLVVGIILRSIYGSNNKIHDYQTFINKIFNKEIINDNIGSICIEPSDLKKKILRRYIQKGTRLVKEDII